MRGLLSLSNRWAGPCTLAFCLGLLGCAALPPVENPVLVRPEVPPAENPIVVAPGLPTAEGYADVYSRVLDAVDDYFEIKPGSRISGQIDTIPIIAPGYEQPWRPGSPEPRQRLLATFQTIRHYAVAKIWSGERGGFRVSVEVYKELEDVQRPVTDIRGNASFQEAPNVERSAQLADAQTVGGRNWIPVGRDYALEQAILRKIQKNLAK